jgi:lipopolysaccharide/colanic/teichoic acid biosynthesis glycosyltransferase
MYYDKIATYARRHNIKPGITGLAQALGHRGATTTLKQMQDRLDCDVTYIQNWSLLLDIKIMLMTVFSSRAYKNAF